MTPAKGSKNVITGVTITRGDRVIKAAAQTVNSDGGRFIFDPAAFAPTEDITIELTGRTRTLTCRVDQAVLRTLR